MVQLQLERMCLCTTGICNSNHTIKGNLLGISAHIEGWGETFIASWKGFRTFGDVLDSLREQFPVLHQQFPDGDDGLTSPQQAAQMLAEIARFEQLPTVDQQAILVDTERKDDVSMGSNVLGGVLAMDRVSGYDLGFDERGFFIRDRWEFNRELFRAMRVEQRLLHPETQHIEYVDLDSGRTFACNVPFGNIIVGDDGIQRMFLTHFHIELRPTPPQRFAYILEPLKTALQASVDLQQPIHWK